MSEKIRVDKFLSSQNVGTRKEISIAMRKGLVTIDNVVEKNSAVKIDPENTEVCFDGKLIKYSKYIYIMMNKPKNLLSATRDKTARTVLDIVPEDLKRKELFPAGRLDKDTTGLLIITDDGDYAHKMLSPKSHVYKLYKATLDIEIEDKDIKAFADGLQSGGINFLPATLYKDEKEANVAYVEIREGKYHQVKKMFYAVGKTVVELERLRIGKLFLDENLKQGESRVLKEEEIQMVFGKIDKNE